MKAHQGEVGQVGGPASTPTLKLLCWTMQAVRLGWVEGFCTCSAVLNQQVPSWSTAAAQSARWPHCWQQSFSSLAGLLGPPWPLSKSMLVLKVHVTGPLGMRVDACQSAPSRYVTLSAAMGWSLERWGLGVGGWEGGEVRGKVAGLGSIRYC